MFSLLLKELIFYFYLFWEKIFNNKLKQTSAKHTTPGIEPWSAEPRHDKTNKMAVRPAKTQISLDIRLVWSESSLSARRRLGSLVTQLSAQRRLCSDWADAQVDLSLRWAHSFYWFCHVMAQIYFVTLLSCSPSKHIPSPKVNLKPLNTIDKSQTKHFYVCISWKQASHFANKTLLKAADFNF